MKVPPNTSLAPSVTATPDKGDMIGSTPCRAEKERKVTRRADLDRNAAVGYARSAATVPGEGVDRQIDGIRRTAAARRLELVQVFADREVSGNKSDREGLSAMLDFLRTCASRPATVFVTSADRLARDVRVFVTLWDELGRLGVALHDVKNGEVDMRPFSDAESGAERSLSGGRNPPRPHRARTRARLDLRRSKVGGTTDEPTDQSGAQRPGHRD